MLDARQHLGRSMPGAYLELHIEQGPVLESMNKPTGVVLGTFGVERHMSAVRRPGRSLGLDADPDAARRVPRRGASALGVPRDRERVHHADARVVCTVGVVKVEPGIVTAVPGVCEISLDQRALDARCSRQMLADARDVASKAARENNVTVEWKRSGASSRGRSIRS